MAFAVLSRRTKSPPAEFNPPPAIATPPAIAPLAPDQAGKVRAGFAGRRQKAAKRVLAAISELRVASMAASRDTIYAAGAGYARKMPEPPEPFLRALEHNARAIIAGGE
jgi:hypothetical protein